MKRPTVKPIPPWGDLLTPTVDQQADRSNDVSARLPGSPSGDGSLRAVPASSTPVPSGDLGTPWGIRPPIRKHRRSGGKRDKETRPRLSLFECIENPRPKNGPDPFQAGHLADEKPSKPDC